MSGIRDWLVHKIGGNEPQQEGQQQGQGQGQTGLPPPQQAQGASPGESGLSEERLREMRLSRFAAASASAAASEGTSPQEKKFKASPPVVASPAVPVAVASPKKSVATAGERSAAMAAVSPVEALLSEDEWESETVARVLFSTQLRENMLREAAPRLFRELGQDGRSAERLSVAHVDRILLECVFCATAQKDAPKSGSNVTLFLYGCFRRIEEQKEKILNRRNPNRMQILSQLQSSVLSFAAIFSSFSSVSSCGDLSLLVLEREEAGGFFGDIIKNCNAEQMASICRQVLTAEKRKKVGSRLLLSENVDSAIAHHRMLGLMMALPGVAECVVTFPEWLRVNWCGKELEKLSILGPFFSVSSFPDEPFVGDALFLNKNTREEIFPVFDRLRSRNSLIVSSLTSSMLNCLKNKQARAPVINYFCAVINSNANRASMRPNMEVLSSHGFMLNFTNVCLNLCEPVFAKLSQISPNYSVFNVGGMEFGASVTRLAMDEGQLAERVRSVSDLVARKELVYNFNTEIFFLTARSLSIGFRPAANYYNNICGAIGERESALNDLASHGQSNAAQIASLRTAISILRKDKFAAEAQVKHPELLAAICRYYDAFAKWFTITADPEKKGIWPADPRAEIAQLPQWMVEDLIGNYEFMIHHAVDLFSSAVNMQNLISFLTLLFSNDRYISSPHLRGKLVDMFSVMLPSKNNNFPPDLFERNKFAVLNIIPALIRFYIDCERTGGNNQFYDKFSIRYRISEIIEHLWNSPNSDSLFRKSLITECRNTSLFLRFVTLLTNDATFLLDEAIHKLEEIHELEKMRESFAAWNALSEQQQEEKNEHLGQLIRATRSYNLLANSSVKLFFNLSTQIVDPFMAPELVDRLAGMLNYFLVQLAGPKCSDLKVRNPQAVGFDPKFLLRMLCAIYSNLGARPEFLNAIVRDERSYKQDVFAATLSILRLKNCGATEPEMALFESFVASLDAAARELVHDEPWSDSDVPDEYQDPIMSTLMRDPVTWEGSHVTCDRAVITRQLLNEPIDPYTRRPLTAAQLVPVPELKKKIDEWIAQQRLQKK